MRYIDSTQERDFALQKLSDKPRNERRVIRYAQNGWLNTEGKER